MNHQARRRAPMAARAFVAALILLGAAGCGLLIRPVREAPIRPNAPLEVTPAGQRLKGHPVEEVLRETDKTLTEEPLTSHSVRAAAEKAMPAVVSIYTETANPYEVGPPLPILGGLFRVPLPGEALGSAFFIHPDGYLLSNNHVIEHATNIKAKTSDGKDYDLLVLARDPANDLALLRVREKDAGQQFAYIPLGKSAETGVGDVVLAIGNPLGLGHTVTQGIISQTHRQIPEFEKQYGIKLEFLQTDTAINPGSSGGPLVTLAGAAVGINAMIILGAQGIGFTIPSDRVREFVVKVLEK